MEFTTGNALEKKKEKFIISRLAEKEYFGRSDIETWLTLQQTAEVPDSREWKKLLQLVHRPELVTLSCDGSLQNVLENVGFPLALRNTYSVYEHVAFAKKIPEYQTLFCGGGNEAFLSFESILFTQMNQKNTLVFLPNEEGGGVYWEELRVIDVLDSARLSWSVLPEGKRKYDARECLCGWLQKGITYAREEAGKEFDSAVGVSEDGSRIIHVDWVFMIRPNGTCCIIKNEFFWDRKLLRPTRLVRFNNPIHVTSGVVPEHVKGILSTLAEKSPWDVRSSSFGEKQVLFCVAFDGYNARLEKCLLCQIGNDE